jgi:hypothetical protein
VHFTPHSIHTHILILSRDYLIKANYVIVVDHVIRVHDVSTHAQTIMSNGAIIVSPHDFEHLSRWYYQL